MPKTVRQRTAEWAKEAERLDRSDRESVHLYALLGIVLILSSTSSPEMGWVYLSVAALTLWFIWRADRKRRRRA